LNYADDVTRWLPPLRAGEGWGGVAFDLSRKLRLPHPNLPLEGEGANENAAMRGGVDFASLKLAYFA
jgi:hypothetical protein